MNALSNPYAERKGETYDDRLVAFRTRSQAHSVPKDEHSIARYFHQYALSDPLPPLPASRGTPRALDAKQVAERAYPAGVPLDVPRCIRYRDDVEELFSARSILSIIRDSKERAKRIVRSHFVPDHEEAAFGIDADRNIGAAVSVAANERKLGVPYDYTLEQVEAAVYRDDREPLSVMMSVRETLSRALSERGRLPDVSAARAKAVDDLANTRVHMACHSDRVRSKELALHSVDIPERFAFGTLRNEANTRARNFRRGATDAQRKRIQNRWDDPASHHLVQAAQRLPSASITSAPWNPAPMNRDSEQTLECSWESC